MESAIVQVDRETGKMKIEKAVLLDERWVIIGRTLIDHLWFPDDTAIIAEGAEDLWTLLERVNREKTELMVISKNPNNLVLILK